MEVDINLRGLSYASKTFAEALCRLKEVADAELSQRDIEEAFYRGASYVMKELAKRNSESED